MPAPTGEKPIADNRRARYEYDFSARWGSAWCSPHRGESRGEGRVTLPQAYARSATASRGPFGLVDRRLRQGRPPNTSRSGSRKACCCIAARSTRSYGKVRYQGLTLIPTRLYFKNVRRQGRDRSRQGQERGDKRRRTSPDREAKRSMDPRTSTPR